MSYQSTILADTPIRYYRLNETGAEAADSSGNSRHGGYSSTGCTLAQTGPISGTNAAKLLQSSGGYVDLSRTLNPAGWTHFTAEFWFNSTSTTSLINLLANGYTSAAHGNNGFQIFYGAGSDNLSAAIGNGSARLTPSAGGLSLTIGSWNLLALVFDGSAGTAKLYVNGVNVGSTSTNAAVTTISETGFSLNIGRTPFPTGDFANSQGKYARLAIYNAALTVTRLASHYANRTSSSAYDADVLSDSPAGYYKLDEASASNTLADSGSQAVDATLTSGSEGLSSAVAYMIDPSVSFGGAESATAATTGLPTGSNPWSLETWVYLPVLNSAKQYAVIFGSNAVGTQRLAAIGVNSSNKAIANTQNDGTTQAVGTTTLTAGAWHHLVGTLSGSTTLKLYLDGALETTATVSPSITLTSFFIGKDLAGSSSNGNQWSGLISEVAVYDYPLTSTQVLAHFNAAAPNYVPISASGAATASGGALNLTQFFTYQISAASIASASGSLALYQVPASAPQDGGFFGTGLIGNWAINRRILPPPDVAAIPESSPTTLLTSGVITLSLSQLDLLMAEYLGTFETQAQATLAIRLHGGWIMDIPILLRCSPGSLGSLNLYITPLRDVLLVTPRYPAQVY